jgi:hypothetical protein
MRILTPFLLVITLLAAGCGSPAPSAPAAASNQPTTVTRPADLDLGTSMTSDQGLFTVSYKSELDPLTINELHTWTVHVETADGQPVDDATVSVNGGMPEHNHGMPTEPLVTPLGSGDYRVEGMKFQMPGWWTVTVGVDAAGRQDSTTFNLVLN